MDDKELFSLLFRKGLEGNEDLLKAKIKDCFIEYFGQYMLQNMQASSSAEAEVAELKEKLKEKEQELVAQKNLCAACEDKIQKLEKDNRQYQEKAENVEKRRKKLVQEFEKQSKILQEYQHHYAVLEDAFKLYSSLGEDVHESLCGILGNGQDRLGLLSGALQEEHLHDFWEYICKAINNDRLNSEQIAALKQIFDLCFELFNQGGREPAYLRLEISIGSHYDENVMLPCLSGAKIGNVENVFLAGYKHRINGNVVKRSLVQLV